MISSLIDRSGLFSSLFNCFSGERVHAYQNPGGLLLLCVWTARVPAQPRPELCQNGPGHVRGHQVSTSVC